MQNSREILLGNKASRVWIKDKTIIKFDAIWNMVYETRKRKYLMNSTEFTWKSLST